MKRRKFVQDSSYLLGLSAFLPYGCGQKNNFKGLSEEAFDIVEITIDALQKGYHTGAFSITDIVTAYLKRIEEVDKSGPTLNSIIVVNPDSLIIAAELDNGLKNRMKKSPMYGVPVILKDNIDTKDKMPCTAGSRALEGSMPLQDSAIAKQLKDAGAIIIGKANLSEWANFRGENSTSGWSGLGGLTKNPYILDRNTCGSSAGSGVSVSANLCAVAIGTETNGSIVCPATTNGVVGIKPTVGLLSRSGIIPISSTQDTAGPMSRTLTDAAICLGVMAGTDENDEKTLVMDRQAHLDYTQFLKRDGLKGKKLAHFTQSRGRLKPVDRLMEKAIDDLKKRGAEVIEIDKIFDSNIGGDSFEIMLYEYKDGLNKYFASLGPDAKIKSVDDLITFNRQDNVELQYFGQEYLEKANAKEDLKSSEYKEALTRMLQGARENGIDKVMKDHDLDAFIAPTGSPAWKSDLVNGDNFHVGSSSPAAQSGYPNITVPMGFIHELPVGISFFAGAWQEPELLAMVYDYEQSTMHRRAPGFLPN